MPKESRVKVRSPQNIFGVSETGVDGDVYLKVPKSQINLIMPFLFFLIWWILTVVHISGEVGVQAWPCLRA